ncbi:hypothetical protein ACLOJK_005662 [Asimina triloba]
MASYDLDDDENSKKVSSGGGGLQGPRPPALKIGKSSGKIKKKQPQQQQAAAGPVIIYIRSPQVIHVEACNFRTLVQQLTGKSPPPSSSSSSKANQLAFGCNSVEVAEDVVREGRDDQEPAAAAGVAGEADGGGLMQLQHDARDHEGEGYNETTNWRVHEAFPASMANNIPPFIISPNVYANPHDFGMLSYSQGFHDDSLPTYPGFNP